MASPSVHVIQLLIRHRLESSVGFLMHPLDTWRCPESGRPRIVLPSAKTVANPLAEFRHGQSLESFVRRVLEEELLISPRDWCLEQELTPARSSFAAVHSGTVKDFTLCPIEIWIAPQARETLRERIQGRWFPIRDALLQADLAPSARAVLEHVLQREMELDQRYTLHPDEETREESPHRLLRDVPKRPSMHARASRWFSENRSGVRILSANDLNQILASGNRAFNLRVADPYLRYQLQGIGFTWSFFTHKDRQDVHVHSAPSVEIYGVIEGRLEVWWKPYHDRGTSAWSRRVVDAGGWIEMEALQCHFVRWLGPGMGVVFKAGPGPLAEVGRLGVKGKTTCEACACVKPPEMLSPPQECEASAKPWGLCVRAMVLDASGRLLLVRRSTASRRFPGLWEIPGGKVECNESPDQALRREVLEETGLEVQVQGLAGSSEFELDHLHVANLFHTVRVLSGTLRISDEHDQFEWVEPQAIRNLDLAPTVAGFLKQWPLSPPSGHASHPASATCSASSSGPPP